MRYCNPQFKHHKGIGYSFFVRKFVFKAVVLHKKLAFSACVDEALGKRWARIMKFCLEM
jgi:hypothetical protein